MEMKTGAILYRIKNLKINDIVLVETLDGNRFIGFFIVNDDEIIEISSENSYNKKLWYTFGAGAYRDLIKIENIKSIKILRER